jgi:hypothetical protein
VGGGGHVVGVLLKVVLVEGVMGQRVSFHTLWLLMAVRTKGFHKYRWNSADGDLTL